MDMSQTIVLALTSINKKGNQIVTGISGILPSQFFIPSDNLLYFDYANRLLKHITEFCTDEELPTWTVLKQEKAMLILCRPYIIYSCKIPEQTFLAEGYKWTDCKSIIDKEECDKVTKAIIEGVLWGFVEKRMPQALE
jgi:hypothetical protein